MLTSKIAISPPDYNDVIMVAIASQITSPAIVYTAVYSDADQRKHQSSASLALVWWIHRWPVNSPHKWPVTRKMFPFDDVIMWLHNHPQWHVWNEWNMHQTAQKAFRSIVFQNTYLFAGVSVTQIYFGIRELRNILSGRNSYPCSIFY